MDAAFNVTRPLARVFELPAAVQQGLVPFLAPTCSRERKHTRVDVFHALFPRYPSVDFVQVTETPQFLTGFSIWNQSVPILIGGGDSTKYSSALEWAISWLTWCTVPGLLDDTTVNLHVGSGSAEIAAAKEHSHDQSVYSVLVKLTLGAAAEQNGHGNAGRWYELDPSGQYRLPAAPEPDLAADPDGGMEPWVHLHRDRS